MQSRHSGTPLQSAILFILSAALLTVIAVAAEPADGNNAMAGEAETTAAESGPATRDRTSEVWEATKEGSAEAWETTKEISSDAWDATKEGSAKAWDKTRELTQPEAEETVETPQADPQGPQP